MKKIKSIIICLIIGILLTCVSCKKVKITLDKNEYTIEVGQELNVEVNMSKKVDIEFKSSDDNIVTFKDGVIKGISEGTATITVTTVGKKKVSVDAEVTVNKPIVIECNFEYKETMDKGTTQAINCILNDEAQNAIITFSSEDESIITIDEEGVVTACQIGTTNIIVNVEKGIAKKTYSLKVVVRGKQSKIYFDLDFVEINEELPLHYYEGEELELPIPSSRGYKFLGWYIDDQLVTCIPATQRGAVTILAEWEKVDVYSRLTFDLDGGVVYATLPEEYLEGSEVELPNAYKEGYSFSGWYNGTTKVTKITKSMKNDLVLTAKWSKLSTTNYTINYYLDGGNWYYSSRKEMADDFYKDFSKNGSSKGNSAESILNDKYAFRNAIVDFFNNEEMYNKWSWICKYLEGKNPSYGLKVQIERVSSHTATDGEYFMQGVVALMEGYDYSNVSEVGVNCIEEDYWELLSSSSQKQFKGNNGVVEVMVPKKQYYIFKGWYNNKLFEGNPVESVSCQSNLYAKWEEVVPVTSLTITNKITELGRFETYQLEWLLLPDNAVNKKVRFESSDKSIATVSFDGLITALNNGTVTIKIISLSPAAKTDEITITVYTPARFEISYETVSYVEIDKSILLNASYIDRQGNHNNVSWSSLTPELASVDANGNVTGYNSGVATIRATYQEGIYQDFYVTVLPEEISEALAFILDSHESNLFTSYDLNIGNEYNTDVLGSVSKILFNEEFVIDTTYNKPSNDKYSDLESRRMSSIEFITVHYTGNMRDGANAKANASYFAQPLESNSTSIHYVTGNDGIFKCLDEPYMAAHAGDTSSTDQVGQFTWRETGLDVLPNDPKFAVVTITPSATFAINGRDTSIKVPVETKNNRGYVTDNKWLNKFGIGVTIKNGKYLLGNAWWCYTQVSEGRICSNGGNSNSIGIESCVNKGSDLWYTWQKTAVLVSDIMVRQNLDITRVKPHHFYSAKNCPQPMIENDLCIWKEFIELVEAEYAKQTIYKDFTFKFESQSDLVNELGRVKDQPALDSVATYTVTISDGDNEQTITLSTIIEGKLNK